MGRESVGWLAMRSARPSTRAPERTQASKRHSDEALLAAALVKRLADVLMGTRKDVTRPRGRGGREEESQRSQGLVQTSKTVEMDGLRDHSEAGCIRHFRVWGGRASQVRQEPTLLVPKDWSLQARTYEYLNISRIEARHLMSRAACLQTKPLEAKRASDLLAVAQKKAPEAGQGNRSLVGGT